MSPTSHPGSVSFALSTAPDGAAMPSSRRVSMTSAATTTTSSRGGGSAHGGHRRWVRLAELPTDVLSTEGLQRLLSPPTAATAPSPSPASHSNAAQVAPDIVPASANCASSDLTTSSLPPLCLEDTQLWVKLPRRRPAAVRFDLYVYRDPAVLMEKATSTQSTPASTPPTQPADVPPPPYATEPRFGDVVVDAPPGSPHVAPASTTTPPAAAYLIAQVQVSGSGARVLPGPQASWRASATVQNDAHLDAVRAWVAVQVQAARRASTSPLAASATPVVGERDLADPEVAVDPCSPPESPAPRASAGQPLGLDWTMTDHSDWTTLTVDQVDENGRHQPGACFALLCPALPMLSR
ncbi:hypothetical protein AMAG_14493 [Allomyces macrogynus ATCC 38327]|uniref:Uncharacterized protein n=1 Tax=Allomyces macrogynus (strain ATCC 38327) TaxID=578462 RepID=A0A0L0T6D1_ALLM3|nr:hypothetical protein AMAG_14493 [Allomyces macrogynus ATCC 38327]|eukprot:KNE70353.1 hypothetical protein AMAG_14493 [Allomyces macrogynus ATCC 38327]